MQEMVDNPFLLNMIRLQMEHKLSEVLEDDEDDIDGPSLDEGATYMVSSLLMCLFNTVAMWFLEKLQRLTTSYLLAHMLTITLFFI